MSRDLSTVVMGTELSANLVAPGLIGMNFGLYDMINGQFVMKGGAVNMPDYVYEGDTIISMSNWGNFNLFIDYDKNTEVLADYKLDVYDTHSGIYNGHLFVRRERDSKFVLVDEAGNNLLSDMAFDDIGSGICGKYTSFKSNGKWGLINTETAQIVFPADYSQFKSNQNYAYGEGDKCGAVVNLKTGEAASFEFPSDVNIWDMETLANNGSLTVNNEVIYLRNGRTFNIKGKEIVWGQYIGIKEDGRYYYFDYNGRKMFSSEQRLEFKNGYAELDQGDGSRMIINNRGQICWYGDLSSAWYMWDQDGNFYVGKEGKFTKYDLTEHPVDYRDRHKAD